MKKSLRTGVAAAVVAGTALAGGATLTASGEPEPTTPSTDRPGYGYTKIRSGVPASAERFTVTSPDVRDGEALPADTWADAFGCTGDNRQIRLSWSGAPEATRSYAITMFDPDAPTGAGFWHWLVWDIPGGHTNVDPQLPAGAITGTGDSGKAGYLGPCPPSDDLTHHYEITVYALDIPTLGIPASTPPTVAAFTMSGHILGYARITGTARR
ncbi:YbhB/YbcL family Raf kinase inhibitor-like protein [Streptomyces sp. SID1046]|uniref:YbhB/YbcL family Raf kinase inhibitor-like protein n=1 Tax=Streptomyces sp. SID1046 TaxID=2690249 RepID=UPI001370A37A|nr:YbhB/YbcL family Raf kinase inhibitor-like protein [Streptomyces sp. SID1046]MYV73042.1 YbhB/YbcL family Raf kinase inhibitor-like protein [Streptomyces sp. SID1046]